jgi:hypothetical protein
MVRTLVGVLALFGAAGASAACPWNTSYDTALNFCTDANNAFGPFTRAMTTACTNGGNGSACTGTVTVYFNGTNITGTAANVQRWGKTLTKNLRGTGTCPAGSILSANYDNHCVESTNAFGTEVYGPFSQAYVDKCLAQSNGTACYFNRWSASVYSSVKNALASAAPAWKLPLPSGYTSSDWCVCRNIGTSPHIGWDLVNNNASMVSVAIESGKITSGPTLNGGCGWELELTDRFGTVWYYRHLNRPNLSANQAIAAGATIGLHQDYPTSSCGSGPHLHFERLSAGYFADSSTGKNCTGTFKSCNYDPRKPFPQFKALATDPLNLKQTQTLQALPEISPDQAAQAQVCRLDQSKYGVESAQALAALQAAPADLQVAFASTAKTGSKGYSANVLSLTAAFAGNPANQCSRDSRCITSMAIYAQKTDGSYARVLSDATLRNVSVALSPESAFCAPADATGTYVIKLSDQRGNSYGVTK